MEHSKRILPPLYVKKYKLAPWIRPAAFRTVKKIPETDMRFRYTISITKLQDGSFFSKGRAKLTSECLSLYEYLQSMNEESLHSTRVLYRKIGEEPLDGLKVYEKKEPHQINLLQLLGSRAQILLADCVPRSDASLTETYAIDMHKRLNSVQITMYLKYGNTQIFKQYGSARDIVPKQEPIQIDTYDSEFYRYIPVNVYQSNVSPLNLYSSAILFKYKNSK